MNVLCYLFSFLLSSLLVHPPPGDQTGECRAHGNLGSAFFSKGNYREALTNHRNQLVLAMKLKDREVRDTHRPQVCVQIRGQLMVVSKAVTLAVIVYRGYKVSLQISYQAVGVKLCYAQHSSIWAVQRVSERGG